MRGSCVRTCRSRAASAPPPRRRTTARRPAPMVSACVPFGTTVREVKAFVPRSGGCGNEVRLPSRPGRGKGKVMAFDVDDLTMCLAGLRDDPFSCNAEDFDRMLQATAAEG